MIASLQHRLRPAPRPRCRGANVYMPDWYRTQQRILAQHFAALDMVTVPVAIDILITREPGHGGDADNLAKPVLDALVQAGVIASDSWHFVPALSIRVLPVRNGERETVTVTITALS